jgi:hypothetical protein
MNKLVIIGNGFDLAHGLKTKYSDFVFWYLQQVIYKIGENQSFEDALIKVDYYQSLPQKHQLNSIQDFRDIVNHRYYPLPIKYKNQFARKLLSQISNENWVDIEALYYSELKEIYKKYEGGITLSVAIKGAKELNDCLNFIKFKLQEYLNLIDCNDILLLSDIKEHIETDLTPKSAISGQALFLNFNYTNTIEQYLKSVPIAYTLNYIHGRLNIKDNPMIFGYGDEIDSHYEKIENLNSNEFLNNFKSFGYLKADNYRRLINFAGANAFEVFIYGHSCGLSDRVLLNSIFEHPNCDSIKIYYHQKSEEENDFYEKTQEISRHFRPASRQIMRKRIVPFTLCAPLVKCKIKSSNLAIDHN